MKTISVEWIRVLFYDSIRNERQKGRHETQAQRFFPYCHDIHTNTVFSTERAFNYLISAPIQPNTESRSNKNLIDTTSIMRIQFHHPLHVYIRIRCILMSHGLFRHFLITMVTLISPFSSTSLFDSHFKWKTNTTGKSGTRPACPFVSTQSRVLPRVFPSTLYSFPLIHFGCVFVARMTSRRISKPYQRWQTAKWTYTQIREWEFVVGFIRSISVNSIGST